MGSSGAVLSASGSNLFLVERNETSDAADGDRLAFITQCKATKRCAITDLLYRNGCFSGDTDEAFGEGSGELRFVFLHFFLGVNIFLLGPDDVFHANFISVRVHVHHALGSFREDRFEEIKQLNLGLQNL